MYPRSSKFPSSDGTYAHLIHMYNTSLYSFFAALRMYPQEERKFTNMSLLEREAKKTVTNLQTTSRLTSPLAKARLIAVSSLHSLPFVTVRTCSSLSLSLPPLYHFVSLTLPLRSLSLPLSTLSLYVHLLFFSTLTLSVFFSISKAYFCLRLSNERTRLCYGKKR